MAITVMRCITNTTEDIKEESPTASDTHGHHAARMGAAGSTYDLRFIDGVVEHTQVPCA